MAEETQMTTAPPEVLEESEKPATKTTSVVEEEVTEEPEKPKETTKEEKVVSKSVSFKEESNRFADLPDPEKKALQELKNLIQQALINHHFTSTPPPNVVHTTTEEQKPAQEEAKNTLPTPSTPPPPPPPPAEPAVVASEVVETVAAVVVDDDGSKTVESIEAQAPQPEEVLIWGIPLLGDERSDVILLKFLRARDFKVKDAFIMIKNTVRWRKEFGVDSLVEEEDIDHDLDKVVFMHGFDKEGHPVCYNVYGEFQNKDLYHKTFSDEEKCQKFIRWRIQFLEKSIRKLDFRPGGICTIVQINDLKNSPGPGKSELRHTTKQALSLLQDNYPEFVAKQIFINVPWWYLAFYRMISPFLTQRTKSKFVLAGPSKSTETLFKYIAPEQVPVQYGGMSKEGDQEFCSADPVTEITIKPTSKPTLEFPVSEKCILVWEVRVVGWYVTYSAEFVPSAEEGYTVIIQNARKITPTDETVVCNSFKIDEPGKVVLTFDNHTSKKKKLVYRFKTKPSSN